MAMEANQARRRDGFQGDKPESSTGAADLDAVQHHKPQAGAALPSRAKEPSSQVEMYEYWPLDYDVDSTRLISILPRDAGCEVRCSLWQVKFADRPKFVALSYMWGDQTEKRLIWLNDKAFYVGQNLYDALLYFEQHDIGAVFWIDAICIDQKDIEERNKQLRMMPHIYFRAQFVAIWLGASYAKYRGELFSEAWSFTLDEFITKLPQDAYQSVVNSLTEILSDGYWHRLWIIQELVRARKRAVYSAGWDTGIEWNFFIDRVTQTHSQLSQKFSGTLNRGPLQLHELLTEEEPDQYSLLSLIERHRDALCKEVVDKVYGFVGLAADAAGFPIDYGRKPFEVWGDTITFLLSRNLIPLTEIYSFSQKLKNILLGGTSPRMPYSPPNQLSFGEKVLIPMRGRIIGLIKVRGPSALDLVTTLAASDNWAATIQRNEPEHLHQGHRENGDLMEYIMDLSDEYIMRHWLDTPLSSFTTSARILSGGDAAHEFDAAIADLAEWKESSTAAADEYPRPSTSNPDDAQAYIHVFLMQRLGNATELPRAGHRASMNMLGLTTAAAESGDLVCWFPEVKCGGVDKLILRISEPNSGVDKNSVQVIGPAWSVSQLSRPRSAIVGGKRLKMKKSTAGFLEIEIKIDIPTLNMLTSQSLDSQLPGKACHENSKDGPVQ
jgi:hypothetical protein